MLSASRARLPDFTGEESGEEAACQGHAACAVAGLAAEPEPFCWCWLRGALSGPWPGAAGALSLGLGDISRELLSWGTPVLPTLAARGCGLHVSGTQGRGHY